MTAESITCQVGKFFDNRGKQNGKSNYAIAVNNFETSGIPYKNLYFNEKDMDEKLINLLVNGTHITAQIVKQQTEGTATPWASVTDVKLAEGNSSPATDLKRVTEVDMGKPVNMAVVQNRNMFVTGIVGRSMQSGKFPITDLPVLTKTAVDCYNEYLRKDFEQE